MARVTAVDPGRLDRDEIDALLERRLIAKLATIEEDGRPHLVSMWFRREGDALLMPTSRHTRKARNLRANPYAAVVVDDSRAGLDLKGVLVRGRVELVEGDDAVRLNRSIHLRYVTDAGLELEEVASYLTRGDDVTIRVHMDEVHSWNLAGTPAGKALAASGEVHALDD
jgi:PPOX class probable F420-dependent enzyme